MPLIKETLSRVDAVNSVKAQLSRKLLSVYFTATFFA